LIRDFETTGCEILSLAAAFAMLPATAAEDVSNGDGECPR
jgi:hypothetical protein